MNRFHWQSCALAATWMCGCVGDASTGTDTSTERGASAAQIEAAEPASAMPPLAVRAARVMAELGPDEATVRTALRMDADHIVLSHREALSAIGPRARASMRRHGVHVEELARSLSGGGSR